MDNLQILTASEVQAAGKLEPNAIVCGDCFDVLGYIESGGVDAVITDPPYPDYYTELYAQASMGFLNRYPCRQIVFWSAKADFPLDYTAIHIWDKKTGCGSMYERIFERNGGKAYRVFRHYLINSTVAASYTGDEFTGHKSQKPIALMVELVERYTKAGDVILDPFAGSFTTAIACVNTGRRFIAIEKEQSYFEIGKKRLQDAMAQTQMELTNGQ